LRTRCSCGWRGVLPAAFREVSMRIDFRPRVLLGVLMMSLLASLSACQSFSSADQTSNPPLIEEQGRAPGALTGGL